MQIKIDNLEFSYSSVSVLNDITVDLTGPKFISIMGPNGVGKSTLIHCINKILTPNGGSVMIDDRDVKTITLKDMAKIVGYVPYTSSDSFPLNVVDQERGTVPTALFAVPDLFTTSCGLPKKLVFQVL